MASSPGLQAGGESGGMQGRRPGTETHRVFRARPGRKSFFKFGDPRAGGQPVRAQGLDHGLNIGFINGLVPVRQESFSYRRSTLDGQHFTACRSYSHHFCSSGSRPLGRYYPELFSGRSFSFDQRLQLFRG